MKKSLFKTTSILTICLTLGLSIGLSACSNNVKSTPKSPKYKTLQTLNKEQKVFFESMLEDPNFIPSPEKSDKSFFEKVKDMFA